jgi:DNA-binding winged helix-turn-helix (wHTH) protein
VRRFLAKKTKVQIDVGELMALKRGYAQLKMQLSASSARRLKLLALMLRRRGELVSREFVIHWCDP